MVGTVANKLLLTVLNTLLDGTLIGVILAVWSIEEMASVFKIGTSCLVSTLTMVRWYYFYKDRKKNNGKESTDTK